MRNRRDGWLALSALRETIRQLHTSYLSTPAAARRVWWRTMFAGMLATSLLSLLLVHLAKAMLSEDARAWEDSVIRSLGRSTTFSFNTAMWLEGIANGFVLWAVVLFSAAVAARRRRPLIALSFLVGYTAVYLPIAVGWIAWDRERPQLIAQGVGDPGGFFHSFPSGHLVEASFAYGLLLSLWYRATSSRSERCLIVAGWLMMNVIVGGSRMRLGAHWPSDIVAGYLLGTTWLAFVLAASRRASSVGATTTLPLHTDHDRLP